MSTRILVGNCLDVLKTLDDGSVHCCVTSPPYWGLRDYGHGEQLGLEATPEEYVANMVEVFREVRRVLRDDGTLWLNLGDSYAADGRKGRAYMGDGKNAGYSAWLDKVAASGLKPKDLVGVPWRVAFALQADGWWLRQDIIWHKPNPMPESVKDRCTRAHEYVFMFSKSARYYYDAEAVAEPLVTADGLPNGEIKSPHGQGFSAGRSGRAKSGNVERKYGEDRDRPGSHLGASIPWKDTTGTRNRRSVWAITTKPYTEAHFATFPPELPEVCILAGCPEGGTILDPFGGAGTTGLVADRLKRNAILIELNPEYAKLAERRIYGDAPLFADVEVAS